MVEQILHTDIEKSEEKKMMELEKQGISKDRRGKLESGEWEFNQQFSEVPYHQEPWWELMHYWISEVMWRRRFWKSNR